MCGYICDSVFRLSEEEARGSMSIKELIVNHGNV